MHVVSPVSLLVTLLSAWASCTEDESLLHCFWEDCAGQRIIGKLASLTSVDGDWDPDVRAVWNHAACWCAACALFALTFDTHDKSKRNATARCWPCSMGMQQAVASNLMTCTSLTVCTHDYDRRRFFLCYRLLHYKSFLASG